MEQQTATVIEEKPELMWMALPKVLYRAMILPELDTIADIFTFIRYAQKYNQDQLLSELPLFQSFSVLSAPPADQSELFYIYNDVDETRKAFLTQLVLTPELNPPNLHLENYRSLSKKPSKESEENLLPPDIFNPLLYLYQNGNKALLKRIYDKAVQQYDATTELTLTSHECFNYSLGLSFCTEYVWQNQKNPATHVQISLMNHFVKAQWAICTYQSVEEFDKHYAALLASAKSTLDMFGLVALCSKLLEYMIAMKNTTLLNHFCLSRKHDFLKENAVHTAILIEAGLNISIALKVAARTPSTAGGEEYLNIARAILRVCANPEDLQGKMDSALRTKIVMALLNDHIEDHPTHFKALRLKQAIELQDMKFFDESTNNPPTRTSQTFFLNNDDSAVRMLINLFHFAKPLFVENSTTSVIVRSAQHDEGPVSCFNHL
jgi:hypothetical protein